jgi:hypothetical protein
MKNKLTFVLFICLINSFQAKCQSENLFIESLNGFNGITETIQKLWSSFNTIDSSINSLKIKEMTIDMHRDITSIVIAKQSIVNKIKNQPDNKIDLKKEVDNLQKSVSDLKSTLLKYNNLINATGMDSQKLSAQLNIEFSNKFNNLENLKYLLPNNSERKEFLITYLESGINILNGTLYLLEKFNK